MNNKGGGKITEACHSRDLNFNFLDLEVKKEKKKKTEIKGI